MHIYRIKFVEPIVKGCDMKLKTGPTIAAFVCFCIVYPYRVYGQNDKEETVIVTEKPPPILPDSTRDFPEAIDEKEAIELGGVVTVDASTPTSAFKDATMEIGTVELSAIVNVAEEVTASITVLAESDLTTLSIDGAVVEWVPSSHPVSIVFGQQTYNFGLLTTQMISDPLITDMVETAGPGVTASAVYKNFRSGAAVLYQPVDEVVTISHLHTAEGIALYDTSSTVDEKQHFIGNLYLDYTFTDASTGRFSLLGNRERMEIDAGFGYAGEMLAVDAELYMTAYGDDENQPAGWFTGCAWNIGERVTTALRYDALSENLLENMAHRVGGGVTLHMSNGIFLAFEYGQTFTVNADSEGEVALQLGLESTLKLPGFQRKTLTKKN